MTPDKPDRPPGRGWRRLDLGAGNTPRRFEVAPAIRIDAHPDILEDVMRRICEWEPGEYALSDESLLSDMVDVDADLDALYARVREIYGIDVVASPQPFLWELIEQIARRRRGAKQE